MGIWPNSTGMVPGCSPTKIVQMVLIGCIGILHGQKIGFQNATFKGLFVRNYKAQSFHMRSSTDVVQIMPLVLKLTLARGSNFYIELYNEKLQTTSSLELLMWIWPNSTEMIPGWFYTCSDGSDWLHKKVAGSKIRFSKSCLKVQGPELSQLMYNIILRSSTHIWWTPLVFLCKWLHCDLWPFAQVSDPGPFGP